MFEEIAICERIPGQFCEPTQRQLQESGYDEYEESEGTCEDYAID